MLTLSKASTIHTDYSETSVRRFSALLPSATDRFASSSFLVLLPPQLYLKPSVDMSFYFQGPLHSLWPGTVLFVVVDGISCQAMTLVLQWAGG